MSVKLAKLLTERTRLEMVELESFLNDRLSEYGNNLSIVLGDRDIPMYHLELIGVKNEKFDYYGKDLDEIMLQLNGFMLAKGII